MDVRSQTGRSTSPPLLGGRSTSPPLLRYQRPDASNTDPGLRPIWEALSQQQWQIKTLTSDGAALERTLRTVRSELTECREFVAVIRQSLAAAQVLSEVQFLVRHHRHHFSAIWKAHGYHGARFDDIFHTEQLALLLALRAGPTATAAVQGVSRAFRTTVREALHVARDSCPGDLYVCGGNDGTRALTSVECYRASVGDWEVLPQMCEARTSSSAGVVAGKLYVCGGWDGAQPVSSVEAFNPNSYAWEAVPPMIVARQGATAGVVHGKLYVAGGWDDGRRLLSSMERLCPERGLWEALPSMSEPRGSPAAGALSGALHICGGLDGQWHPLSSAERFNIYEFGRSPGTGGVWEPVPNMSEGRAVAVAATLGSRLYVCGGYDGLLQPLSSTERLLPEAGTWETIASMSCGRSYAAGGATAGCLYVFGGRDGAQVLKSAEIFDPATGSWKSLPPMSERRSGTAAAATIP